MPAEMATQPLKRAPNWQLKAAGGRSLTPVTRRINLIRCNHVQTRHCHRRGVQLIAFLYSIFF